MPTEDGNIEYKSLKKVIGKSADLKSLSETCVSFANAQGGLIVVGIEDEEKLPDSKQKIKIEDVNNVITRLRDLTDSVALANPEIIDALNGGQYFQFKVLPSSRTIATTSSGKVLIRITDKVTFIEIMKIIDDIVYSHSKD